jgi:lactoylglutathione lyase
MSFLHVCMHASDAETLADWYVANLGFERSWEFTENGTRNLFVADEDGVEIQIRDADADLTYGTGWDHVAVEVDSVDRALEDVDHAGVVREAEGGPDSGARTAFVEDPEGHVIELIQLYE